MPYTEESIRELEEKVRELLSFKEKVEQDYKALGFAPGDFDRPSSVIKLKAILAKK